MIKENSENRYLSKNGLFVLIILLVTLFAVDYFRTTAWLEPTQSKLTDIVNIETLREHFNRDVGNIRLIIIVAPT
jgi:hypothetical protein